MRLALPVLAYALALLAAPFGATGAVLGLAKGAGRLTRWHSETNDSSWMMSMPLGGFSWQIITAVTRALGAFAAARLILALFAVRPTLYVAAGVVLMLLAWDVYWLRFVSKPSWRTRPPPEMVRALQFKVEVGMAASLLAALVFLRA